MGYIKKSLSMFLMIYCLLGGLLLIFLSAFINDLPVRLSTGSLGLVILLFVYFEYRILHLRKVLKS